MIDGSFVTLATFNLLADKKLWSFGPFSKDERELKRYTTQLMFKCKSLMFLQSFEKSIFLKIEIYASLHQL